ncbi:MAG: hypothetical protein NKF70_09530 [Methanobacterium sp. ERen5]|nr:MAG: hypothetical protein NKF70_09530 [Methanobacterium sp. ERen5]
MNQQEMDRLVDSLLIYMPMFYKKLTTAKETDTKKSSYKKEQLISIRYLVCLNITTISPSLKLEKYCCCQDPT